MAKVVYDESFDVYQSLKSVSFYCDLMLNLPLVGSNIKCLAEEIPQNLYY
jgi:hypothetical protein